MRFITHVSSTCDARSGGAWGLSFLGGVVGAGAGLLRLTSSWMAAMMASLGTDCALKTVVMFSLSSPCSSCCGGGGSVAASSGASACAASSVLARRAAAGWAAPRPASSGADWRSRALSLPTSSWRGGSGVESGEASATMSSSGSNRSSTATRAVGASNAETSELLGVAAAICVLAV
jgi:hypothetical protein